MSTLIQGLHHVTLCAGDAQQDVDFFTGVMGQRLVKQSVLMDGRIPVYHLYYGNADADVGSIMTTFPYARRAGRAGSGQVSVTSYAVPADALRFWREHLARHGVEHGEPRERFGQRCLRVCHPAGLALELIEDASDTRRPWVTSQIGADAAARGFFGVTMAVRDACEQEGFLCEALGLKKVGVDGAYHRYEIPGFGVARTVDVHHQPDSAPGSWGFGAGTVHHVAFNVETDEALVQQKALLEELGFTDASELKDRYYFHSMYVRSPGGVLVECTANVPGGFLQDESFDDLGASLHLPPWYQEQRDVITAALEPLIVPDDNRPAPGTRRGGAAAAPPAHASRVPLSRTPSRFVAPPR